MRFGESLSLEYSSLPGVASIQLGSVTCRRRDSADDRITARLLRTRQFNVRHARRKELDRVIRPNPYTSATRRL